MKNLKGTIKTMSPLPATPVAIAPPVPKVKTESVVTVLPTILKEDGTPIVNYNQALALSALKFEEGEPILTLEDRPFLYEIVNMLNTLDYEVVYNFLNVGWEKVLGSGAGIRKRMIFENPLLVKSKDKLAMDMEIYRNQVDVGVGMVNCKKCNSTETLSVEKQKRSSDEPTSVTVKCLQCQYKWQAQ